VDEVGEVLGFDGLIELLVEVVGGCPVHDGDQQELRLFQGTRTS
jgi:hypothetical protein